MKNYEKMSLTLTRIEVCDLLIACISADDLSGAEKWMKLHDKIKEQLNKADEQ